MSSCNLYKIKIVSMVDPVKVFIYIYILIMDKVQT